MHRERFKYLHKKFLDHSIDDRELQEYLLLLEDHEEVFGEGLQEYQFNQEKSVPDKDRVFDDLLQRAALDVSRRRVKLYRWIGVACGLLLVFGFSFYLWNHNSAAPVLEEPWATTQNQETRLVDTLSGAIQLADGTNLALSEIQEQPVSYAGVRLSKVAEGLIQVEFAENPLARPQTFHEFRTKKGISYSLLLPDGSKVHLNSDSRLKLHVDFNVSNRECDLSGEGFFEVAHHRELPFEVHVRDYAVKVLGTQFNLKSYPQMSQSNTALMEGRVQVSSPDQHMTLVPGQQVSSGVSGQWIKQKANFREILAWREGYFRFSNASLREIMNDIITWYDIDEVVYEQQINDHFTGSIVRSRSLQEVLHGMEKIANLDFEIKERRVIVRK
ncbi:MAG: FecR family protein [Sphingobacterium sp.]